jgi:plasmid maintenance system antidote protein VapI
MRTFSDQLRHLIVNSGETTYRISQATKIERATLSRFLNRKGGLSMPNLDKLGKYLGWTITGRK